MFLDTTCIAYFLVIGTVSCVETTDMFLYHENSEMFWYLEVMFMNSY